VSGPTGTEPVGPSARGVDGLDADTERTAGLVDPARLGAWMDRQGLPGEGELLSSRYISGGASNEISLLHPGTMYGERLHQVDIRASKAFNIGGGLLARVTVDIANLLNENTVIGQSNTYGPNWLRPNSILFGRIIKPGLLLEW